MDNPFPNTRILVVDDEKKAQSNLKRMLELKRFKVLVAHDGKDALAKVDVFDPECVLLDIRMPYMNGIDVLKLIKEKHPRTEVIMVTAVTSLKIAEGCLEDGAFAVIEKPLNFPYLMEKIVAALEKRSNDSSAS